MEWGFFGSRARNLRQFTGKTCHRNLLYPTLWAALDAVVGWLALLAEESAAVRWRALQVAVAAVGRSALLEEESAVVGWRAPRVAVVGRSALRALGSVLPSVLTKTQRRAPSHSPGVKFPGEAGVAGSTRLP